MMKKMVFKINLIDKLHIIVLYLFIIGVIVLSVLTSHFIFAFIVIVVSLFASTFYLRWILKLDNKYILTFFILEGIRKRAYTDIQEVKFERKSIYAGGEPKIISFYFKGNKGKLKYAKLEVGNIKNMILFLNFLLDRIEIDTINLKSFEFIGIFLKEDKFLKVL